MSCAPFFDIARSNRSPPLSMNVTSLRSITQVRLSSIPCALFQVVLSSLTHGSTKRPCTIHLLSVGVSVMVIFSTSASHLLSVWPELGKATQMPELGLFRQQRNFLICLEIRTTREVRQIRVLKCYCRAFSSLLISWHIYKAVLEVGLFGEGAEVRNIDVRLCSTA
jgi:hypothetical protein